MFDPPEDGDLRPKGLAYAVWIVCVCHRSDNVCVEVSRPRNFSGGWYEGFYQRVFIADSPLDDLGAPFESSTDDNASEKDSVDPDVPVTRKKAE